MGSPGDPSAAERRCVPESWLSAFSELLKAREYDRVVRMMHADCYWRDLLNLQLGFQREIYCPAISTRLQSRPTAADRTRSIAVPLVKSRFGAFMAVPVPSYALSASVAR
jgi:hypothetical protein